MPPCRNVPVKEVILPPFTYLPLPPSLTRCLGPCSGVRGRDWPQFSVGPMPGIQVIDKAAAWTEVQTLATYDDGNTATNTLYWVATRP